MATHPYIFNLPYDILFIILDLCRPFDFESAVLTCKTFYEAGAPNLKRHNALKLTWRQDPSDWLYPYVQPGKLKHLLPLIKDAPQDRQLECLRYADRVMIFVPVEYPHWQFGNDSNEKQSAEYVVEMLEDCPEVYAAMTEVASALPKNMRNFFKAMSWVFPKVPVGGDTWRNNPALQFHSEPADLKDRNWDLPIHFETTKGLMETVLLPLFSNMRVLLLVNCWAWLWDTPNVLATLVSLYGHSSFANLEEVYFLGVEAIEYPTLALIYSNLPSLHSFTLEEASGDFAPHFSIALNPENTIVKPSSSVERLLIFNGTWRSEQMILILKSMPALNTICFCEDGHVDSYSAFDTPEEHMEWFNRKYGNPEDNTRMEFNTVKDVDDNVSDTDSELDQPLVIGDGSFWDDMTEIAHPEQLFRPSSVLGDILVHHADKLERLGLNSQSKRYGNEIQRQFKIRDFKGLSRLTHLEIDSRILRNKIKYNLTSLPALVDILPPSIQVVGVIITAGFFLTALRLLNSLPENKSKLPALRKILIRYQAGPQGNRESKEGEKDILKKLVDDHQVVGVELILRGENLLEDLHLGDHPPIPVVIWEGQRDPSSFLGH
jgi:hypothetical protein